MMSVIAVVWKSVVRCIAAFDGLAGIATHSACNATIGAIDEGEMINVVRRLWAELGVDESHRDEDKIATVWLPVHF